MAISRLDSASASAAEDTQLGEVLERLSSHQPHTIVLPARPTAMQTYGDGVVVGLMDGKVLLVCVAPPTSYCLESANPHTEQVVCLAVAGDMCLSGAYDGSVKVWSLTERKEMATLSGHQDVVMTVIITPNGLVVSAGWDKAIKVWDLQARCEICSLEGHTEGVSCLAISPDSQYLYSADRSGSIKVWDLGERKEIITLLGHSWGVTGLSLSSDGKLLYSCSGLSDIRIWNLVDKKEISVLTGEGHIIHIRVLPRRKICLSVTIWGGITLWNLSTNRKLASWNIHTDDIQDIDVLKNEQFCLTCSTDLTIRLWDLEAYEEVAVFRGHKNMVELVKLTEDNSHFVSGSNDGTLKIWSLAKKKVEVLEGFKGLSQSFSVTQDLVITIGSHIVKMWSLKDLREVEILQGNKYSTNVLAVTPDLKTLIVADDDFAIRIWSLERGTLEHAFQGLNVTPNYLALTSDGKQLVSSTGRTSELTLWSLEKKCLIGSVFTTELICAAVAIRPNGACAVCTHETNAVSIWSLPKLESLGKLSNPHDGSITNVAFTPDGQTLITSGFWGNEINMWQFDQGIISTTFQVPDLVRYINMSRDGLYVISTCVTSPALRVWSLVEKREFAYNSINGSDFINVGFSADGRRVICLSPERVFLSPFVVPWKVTDATSLQVTSDIAAIVTDLISGKRMGRKASKLLVTPYRINSLHISAFYNHSERARESLAAGVPFLKGTFGSPLTVALQRKTVKCVEVFLNYLTGLAKGTQDDLEWPIFTCIADDIPVLLRCESPLLRPFFEVLLQRPAVPVLPYFITPRSDLPIVIFTDNRLLHVPDFDMSPKGQIGSELVKFNISLIRQNLTPGSAPSLELVEALQDCEDKTVLNTPYISTVIEEKWAYFYPFTLAFTLLYATMLASLVMLLFNVWETTYLASTFIAINAFFIAYEMAQMVVDKWAYWMDPWNYVDIFRVVLSLFWGTLMLLGQEHLYLSGYQRDTRLWLALLCLLRGFTYFRSFRATRLFVYMTLAVIKEMYSFLFIMVYSVFAFGVCTSVLLGHASLGESWTSAFSLVLGDFDSSAFGFLEWLIFSCAAITNVIIMLNLLVSILGDAYEMTQMSVRENDLFLMLELVNEYESLMFWRRSTGSPLVMFTCDRAKEAESASDWAGQVSKITEKMKEEVGKSTESIQERVSALKDTLETLEGKIAAQKTESEKVQEQLIEAMKAESKKVMEAQRTMEEKVTEAQKKMEEKLEAILVLYKDRS